MTTDREAKALVRRLNEGMCKMTDGELSEAIEEATREMAEHEAKGSTREAALIGLWVETCRDEVARRKKPAPDDMTAIMDRWDGALSKMAQMEEE